MSSAPLEEEDEFEMQLRQEELARLAKEEGETLSRGLTYTDEDGTVMEWDPERRAYFPKIDTDFLAQYQMNYGINYGDTSDLTEEQKQAQYNEYWKNYYDVISKEQPALPKLDEEGNEVEEEKVEGDTKPENKSQPAPEAAATKEQIGDPTSDEHYEYNLYYFGQEYADAYRDYYRQHPDAEVLPDFISQRASAAPQTDNKKDKKKKKEAKGEKRKENPAEVGWFEINPESSTQLYVTGLPLDITEDEFKDVLSKCGLIMFDPLTKKPKFKLYKDRDGNLKGDGLCTYIKPESVNLALQILDGMDIRGNKISVERAKFEMKGEFDPSKKKKKLNNKAKQKLKERQQKLFDWRPDKLPFQRAKHERIVILKNMFNIREFEENPALINELRAEVREECQKFGEVTKVALYDRNPEGVMSVTFKEPEEADKCIAALNGRWFAQNRVVAFTHDGKTKYDVVETEEERAKRLQDWEAYLEGKKKKEAEEEAGRVAVTEELGDEVAVVPEETETESLGFNPNDGSDMTASDSNDSSVLARSGQDDNIESSELTSVDS
ncbi:HIV Tat-specific factor 1 [Biomphalaria pfeifferi]|uniref:17S U2 SnRNP complex component HTATSF1 n=1 Tax=Biomphalaria pfeifferi TaxID=112525 RepID=A0AAD8F7X6_BIOPF|nr:HIV Tat-specific factor 1 [Biomphalaria pfeifferi]